MIAILNGIKNNYTKTLKFSIVIVSIAFMVAGGFSAWHSGNSGQIDTAQSQRIYAERIAKQAIVLAAEQDQRLVSIASEALQLEIDKMEQNHQSLLSLDKQLDDTLKNIYFEQHKLDQAVKDLLFNARQVLAAKKRQDEPQLNKANRYFVSNATNELGDKLNMVVEHLSAQKSDADMIVVVLHVLMWLIASVLIFVIGKSQFKPIAEQLDDTVNQLQKENAKQVKSKEQALDIAHKKDRYLASIIEEIRGPVHGVLGMVNLLKQTNSAEQRSYYANKIENATSTLSHLTKQVHDFSQAESGALVIEKKEFLVLQLIDDVVAVMKPRAKKKQLQLFVRVAMDFPQKNLR